MIIDRFGLMGFLIIDIFLFGVLCGAKIMFYKLKLEQRGQYGN
jgi:hypothetical protein